MDLPIDREAIALVVLCGGRGARLGGIVKPLLRFDRGLGPTLLEHLEQVLSPRVARVVLVAPQSFHARLSAHSGAQLFEDRGRGPGEALLDTARAVGEPWLFLVAGDQPEPSVALFDRLVSLAGDAVDAVVVREGSTRYPAYALYRRAALLSLTRVETARGVSLHGVLDALELAELEVSELPSEEQRALGDVDEPADLERYALALDPEANG